MASPTCSFKGPGMTEESINAETPGLPARRRVRVADSMAATDHAASPVWAPLSSLSGTNLGASSKQDVLTRVQAGWFTLNDVAVLCGVSKRTAENWFQRFNAVPFSQTGLPIKGPLNRSNVIRRADLEIAVSTEGWWACGGQQDDPAVTSAMLGQDRYPLLNRLFTWAQEKPRRLLPLLDLCLELQLTPNDLTFDLNREIDWAEQAGLMHTKTVGRPDRLAIPTRSQSRPEPVNLDDLVTLEEWTANKPFRLATTRALARARKLEHQHVIAISDEGQASLRLVPSWAEILSEPEDPTLLDSFIPLTTRGYQSTESPAVLALAIDSGILASYQWGNRRYVETRRLAYDEIHHLNKLNEQQELDKRKQKAEESWHIVAEQADDLLRRLTTMLSDPEVDRESGKNHLPKGNTASLLNMCQVACMRARGATLEACGTHGRVTRERARQVLLRYARCVLVAQGQESGIRSTLEGHNADHTFSAVQQRLYSAMSEQSLFGLSNQIFLELQLVGYSSEMLRLPIQAPRNTPIPKVVVAPAAVPEGVSEPDQKVLTGDSDLEAIQAGAPHLLAAVDAILECMPDQIPAEIARKVRRVCDLACLVAQGRPIKLLVQSYNLTPLDVSHLLKSHLQTLALVRHDEADIARNLEALSGSVALPPELERLRAALETADEGALVNALYIETELFRNTLGKLKARIAQVQSTPS